MCKPHPNRGLSLPELLVAMALLVVIMVLGLSGLRVDPKTGRSQALAHELKGLFSRARAQAVSSGVPVGLVLPSSGGATPIATECALLSGSDLGKLERRLSFEGNYPGVGLFVGQWALPSGQSFELPVPPTGTEPPRFNITSWLPSDFSTHAAYVFLPSGQIVTNNLPAVGGEYPVVVASRLATSGTDTLAAADDAYTVLVSERATSRVEKGVLGGQVPLGGGGSETWTLASLSGSAPLPQEAPEITAVEVLPAPIDTAFAAALGAECIIEQNGVVSLRVKAKDADGGPLYCQWSASQGGLSHPTEIPMLYSPEQDAWVAEWHWRPPDTAEVDDIFEVSVAVRDEWATATAAAGVMIKPRILVVDRGILAFSTTRNFSAADPEMRCHAFSVRYDGTDLRAIAGSLSTAGFEGGMSPSRDGRRVVVGSDYGGGLQLISSDGAEARVLPLGGTFHFPYFSPDSTEIYVARGGASLDPHTWTMSRISFDASGNPVVDDCDFPGIVTGWSPDGAQALIQTPDGDVQICNRDDETTAGPPLYAGTDPGGPAIALDWNSRGIFYGNAQSETNPYPNEPGTFEVHRNDGTDTVIGTYRTTADVGGDGRYIFHIADGVRQDDLINGTTRLIVPGFVEAAPGGFAYRVGARDMYKAARRLFSSN